MSAIGFSNTYKTLLLMVVQSKQLRANAAKVDCGLSWDPVELKCREECGKSQSPPRAVFVWNLMAVKHCLCLSATHQHTQVCPAARGVSRERETQELLEHIRPHSDSVGKVHC